MKRDGKDKYTFDDLAAVTRKLRSEGGCPWDRAQTHESLKPYLKEEAGEALEAMLHSQIAEEEGYFTIEDVVDGICDKMVFRHPQVFGGENAAPDGGVPLTWEELKNLDKLRKNRYKNR